MRLLYLLLIISTVQIYAGLKNLTLSHALALLEKNNLEIKAARYEETMKFFDISKVKAKNFGSLELTSMVLRSNDAGNVFGFKMQSREASFADFGFDEFLAPLGGALMKANSNSLTPADLQGMSSILGIEPKKLNYPSPRTHYLTKFTYKIPLYTGGMLTHYKNITQKLYEMSKLDTSKVLAKKRFELKKAFYDVALVNSFIASLHKIKSNIIKLRDVVKQMQKEGYAVETDYLEIDAKVSEIDAMLNEAKLNRELAYEFISFLIDKDVDSIKTPKTMPKIPKVTKAIVEAKSLDIAKAKLGLKVAKNGIGVAKSKFKPTIGAFAEYGYADKRFIPKSIKNKDYYTVGVQLKMNLFNGGADYAELEKSKLKYMQVATQVNLAKKGIWLKVNKLKSEIKSLNYRVKSFTKQYKFAKKIYLTYKEKYRVGLVSITDLLIKQSKELEVLMRLQQVKNKRNAKILELQNVINE